MIEFGTPLQKQFILENPVQMYVLVVPLQNRWSDPKIWLDIPKKWLVSKIHSKFKWLDLYTDDLIQMYENKNLVLDDRLLNSFIDITRRSYPSKD